MLVIELEGKKDCFKLSQSIKKNFIAIMASCNSDIECALLHADMIIQFKLIKYGQMDQRKIELKRLNIDAIYHELHSKAKFILLI